MNNRPSYRPAKVLIARYGAEAESHAREKLESLARKGAMERTAIWWRILAAVQELRRSGDT